jgi:hypothetical protein
MSDELYVEPDEDGFYQWEDENGLQYYGSEDELDAWAEENGYVDAPQGLAHPDQPLADFGGASLRDIWNTLPDNDRRAARERYAVERYKELKNQ